MSVLLRALAKATCTFEMTNSQKLSLTSLNSTLGFASIEAKAII